MSGIRATKSLVKKDCPVLELGIPERWKKIVELHRSGLNDHAIARYLGINKNSVSRVLDMPQARFR